LKNNVHNALILVIFLILPLGLLWIFSFRAVRSKIGDYYFKQNQYVQAAYWYEKSVRKDGLNYSQSRTNLNEAEDNRFKLKSMTRQQGEYCNLGQSGFNQTGNYFKRQWSKERLMGFKAKGNELKYEDDLSKLKLAIHREMEKRLLKAGQFLGFGQKTDLKYLLDDRKLFHMELLGFVGTEAKKEMRIFDNVSNKFKNLFRETSDLNEFNYLISIGYFFKGLIDEEEGNFSLANLNYEKVIYSPEITTCSGIRQKILLAKMADKYSKRLPNFGKAGNVHVLLESEDPLIVAGVSPGPDNFLEYTPCAISPKSRLTIRGEVLGGSTTSCIVPRIVFWGLKGYIGEASKKYSINRNFNISYQFSVPSGTSYATPRITFYTSCFSDGQKVLIREFKVNKFLR
jgi:hypothetical protein